MNTLLPLEIQRLRDENYNATITDFRLVQDDLAIIRVRPDGNEIAYTPGQYTVLGLGYWEPRLPQAQPERLGSDDFLRMARRAYSISNPIVQNNGEPLRLTIGAVTDDQTISNAELEFYIALVLQADHPPALTPRLFASNVGDRIYVSEKCHGHYTLAGVKPKDHLVFLATGTGEAPHNSMLAELLARDHRCPIVTAVCTRYQRDLGYLSTHRLVERTHPNYSYLPLTTREPENLDAANENYVGKRYLQDYFSSGQMERDCGFQFDPNHTHVYLCGNPDMIGVPRQTHDMSRRYPEPTGMVELLERRGFHVDRPHESGNIHFEKYW